MALRNNFILIYFSEKSVVVTEMNYVQTSLILKALGVPLRGCLIGQIHLHWYWPEFIDLV